MVKKSWQDSRDVDEIMKLIERTNVDKFRVLSYFGQTIKDLDMLEKLLNSGYYTPEEIAKRAPASWTPWKDPQARQMILEFSDKAWQKIDDAQAIIDLRVGIVPSEFADLQRKIKYYKTQNPELYQELWDLSSNQGFSGGYKYFKDLLKNQDENREEIVDILLRHPGIIANIDYESIDSSIREDMIKRRNEIIHSKDWKNQTVVEKVMYRVTEENKWEVFEYFATNNVYMFNRIVRDFVGKKLARILFYSVDEILERYNDEKLSERPEPIRNLVENLVEQEKIKEEKNEQRKAETIQRRHEQMLSWCDKNGEFLKLFTLGKVELQSREDYEKVLQKFLQEDMSIPTFCIRYKISDRNGFVKMLEKFAYENPKIAEQINSKNKDRQERYLTKAKEIIYNIVVKGDSVEELIKYAKTYSLDQIIWLSKELFNDKKVCEILATKIVYYYANRLNSYDSSMEPENIDKMLTKEEIMFIVGDQYDSIMKGKSEEIEKIFFKNVSFVKDMAHNTMYYAKFEKIFNFIKNNLVKYNNKFKSGVYFRNKNSIITENGNIVDVTREMVDMAFEYAYSKGLHTSTNVMNSIINAVAKGKIQNVERTRQSKKAMLMESSQMIDKITSIDDYFVALDNLYQ